MMKFGMPTLIETKTVKDAAALCRELSLDFLELNTNFPLHQPHLLEAKELNDLAQKYGIFYTIHLNDEMAVAEFNPLVAEGYRAAAVETIELAKKIGVKTINMHLSEGAKYTTPQKVLYFYEEYRREFLAGMRAFRDVCVEAIGDSGITICVENTVGYKEYQKKVLEMLLEAPCFGLTLDIGHNYCAGGVDESWILEHKDRLRHMHIHDAKNGRNDHQALGTGELDIPGYMRLAGECGCTAVLETKTVEGLRQSVTWAKEKGFMK